MVSIQRGDLVNAVISYSTEVCKLFNFFPLSVAKMPSVECSMNKLRLGFIYSFNTLSIEQ